MLLYHAYSIGPLEVITGCCSSTKPGFGGSKGFCAILLLHHEFGTPMDKQQNVRKAMKKEWVAVDPVGSKMSGVKLWLTRLYSKLHDCT